MFEKYRAYIQDNPHGYWFKAKWYGWGWTPATWQGWLIVFLYVALVFAFSSTIDDDSSVREVAATFVFPITLLTIALIRVCYRTGEAPRWQWGAPRKGKK